jgi:hypothetical protein
VARGFLELLLFIGIDIRSVALGEAVGENCAVPPAEKDNRAVPARFSLACPCDPLLDHAAAEVGIHLSFSARHSRPHQHCVADLFLRARRSNHLVLKDSRTRRSPFHPPLFYSTEYHVKALKI